LKQNIQESPAITDKPVRHLQMCHVLYHWTANLGLGSAWAALKEISVKKIWC